MKKALLLSCSTGQGHNSCAQAIAEYFEQQGVSCEIKDSFAFASDGFSAFLSWGHSFMYRYIPGLFDWGYGYGLEHPNVFSSKPLAYKALTAGAEDLSQYIVKKEFDTVICTHVLSAILMTNAMKRYSASVRTAFVATDYTSYPGMEACNLEMYFVPDESLVDEYCKCGIPKERVFATGIPIRQSFLTKIEKTEAKKQLRIKGDRKHLLIMCGSMGCGSLDKLLEEILKVLNERWEITVICGTNERKYREMSYKYRKYAWIHIVGYTDQISLYMDSADFYLTKPGGVSITEAAAKCLPMGFVNAVAGCEQYNMGYFLDMGAAVTGDTYEALAARSAEVMNSDRQREQMAGKLQDYWKCDGARQIYEIMEKELIGI